MTRNDELFARAQRTIPAGVNSPVRAFRSVGGTPRFFARGEGAVPVGRRRQALHRLRRLLGAADPRPRASRRRATRCRRRAPHGLSFGAPTELEIEMAETLVPRCCRRSRWCGWCPRAPRRRCRALRLARGFTGRSEDRQVRGLLPRPRRQPAGEGGLGRAHVRPAVARPACRRRSPTQTIVLAYNDLDAVEAAFARGRRRRSPCIIVEPVAGNMNLVVPTRRVPRRRCARCATGTARC